MSNLSVISCADLLARKFATVFCEKIKLVAFLIMMNLYPLCRTTFCHVLLVMYHISDLTCMFVIKLLIMVK